MLRRFYAATYDTMVQRAEAAGLASIRRQLLARAAGSTLELGPGTGLNLPDLPTSVSRLVLVEPDQHMARRLAKRTSSLRTKPRSNLLFLERVRSDDARVASRQDKAARIRRMVGCHPNRETLRALQAPPLHVATAEHRILAAVPAVERCATVGVARCTGPEDAGSSDLLDGRYRSAKRTQPTRTAWPIR